MMSWCISLKSIAFVAGSALALVSAPVLAGEESPAAGAAVAEQPAWPFETSDLEPDPGFVYGQLPNGMRYILRENATPEGTALVRMRIGSGSLDETEDERGLSHFLEHMAFNGSRNIPEGEMVRLLEREGLSFGADTNASTGFKAITYKLNLPRNDIALLDTALMLMRETASELTIAPEAVERERGVVLAERRDRAGFAQRNSEDAMQFLTPGARYTQRLPIGTIQSLEVAGAEQLRSLYERTYTPANTVLIIVGDFPVEMMEAAIRERFADWASAPAPNEPQTGPVDVARSGLTDIHVDPALSEGLTIVRLGPWRDEPDSIATRQTGILRGIGHAIINRRLARLARAADAPFRSASYGSGDIFEDARTTSLAIASVDGEWRKGMMAAVQEVNQALTHGFTAAEIDEQIRRRRNAAENAVANYGTWSNATFAGQALSLVSDERIPVTPDHTLALFEDFVATITPRTVLDAVRDHAVPLEDPMIRFTGRTAPAGGEAALREAFAEAMAIEVSAPENSETVTFAYDDFGSPGAAVSDETDPRFGIRKIVFANGVRLNLKHTDIRADRVQVAVRIDGGKLLASEEEPLRVYLADSLTSGGLGAHDLDQIQTALAGRSVGFRFAAAPDGFAMSATTTPRDLDLQLKVFAATLTDPGYRAEGVERFRRGIDNFFATLDATPGRAYAAAAGALLSDGDPRFSLQPKSAYEALDFAQLRGAIEDRLSTGAIEIAIVGDVDENAVIDGIARTFGALPPREEEFHERREARQRHFTQKRGLTTLEHSGEADQALLRMVWPTTDDSDLAESLRLMILARIARLELTDSLREELGQAYSPSATSSPSRVYDGYGTFSLSASVDVSEIEQARAAIRELVERLRYEPVDPDLLDRARKPVLEAYANALKDLGGWMRLASRAQSEPDRVDRWVAAPAILEGLGPQDIAATASRYLNLSRAVEVHVLPGPNARLTGNPDPDDPEAEEE